MSRQIDPEESDHVGARIAQWRREQPDIDTLGMAILGRARWITLQVRPAIEVVFAKHDLDTGEFDVLSTLLRSGPPYRLRPTELYRSLMISSGGLTDRLSRLERAGLIDRATDTQDARSKIVALTEKGRALAETVFREDMEVEAGLISDLSEEDRAHLSRLLAKLSSLLSARDEARSD